MEVSTPTPIATLEKVMVTTSRGILNRYINIKFSIIPTPIGIRAKRPIKTDLKAKAVSISINRAENKTEVI